MNGRERMLAAMDGKSPDVCPAAPLFWGAEYVWRPMGRSLEEQCFGPDPGWLETTWTVHLRHRADWILLNVTEPNGWLAGKERIVAGRGARYRDPSTGKEYEFDPAGHFLRELGGAPARLAELTAHQPAGRPDIERLFAGSAPGMDPESRRRILDLAGRNGGERFLCGCVIAPFVDVCYRLGTESALITLLDWPEAFVEAEERALALQEAAVADWRETGVDGVLIAESYASVDMIAPDQYRRFAWPFQRDLVRIVQAHGLRAILFSTGDLLPLLADMARLCADALIVEEGRKGRPMDIGEVRRAYGTGCLFGNVSAEQVLLGGSQPAIRRECEYQIAAAGAEGAFILSNGASPVCDATPPEAVDALVETAHAHRYPG